MPDHVMNYVECDAPAGRTLAEWRRARVVPAPRRRTPLFRRLSGLRRRKPAA